MAVRANPSRSSSEAGPAIRRPRAAIGRLSPPLAFALVGAIISLALFASATPTPLYSDYAARWHFSTPVLTSVYAVYAVGVLAALLLVGRVSDQVGRRPVLLVALAGLLGSTTLFMLAGSVEWLFAARAVQGLATGAALGAAGAALLDLQPTGDARNAGLVNGVASASGIAVGALVSSALVEELPAPRLTPYLLLFALFALAWLATLALPESVERRGRLRLTPQRPRVPAGIRTSFVLATTGVVASWAIAGLYLALAPTLMRELLDSNSHLVGGIAVFAVAGPGALGQLLFHRLPARRAMAGGALVLAGGMAATVLAISIESAALFFAASVVTGGGFGVAFLGSIRTVSVVAPADQRAEVMSAFYVVAYLAISLPTVVAGLSVPELGLESTFQIYGLAVTTLALAAALGTRHRSLAAAAAAG